jgi:hypothetical protein
VKTLALYSKGQWFEPQRRRFFTPTVGTIPRLLLRHVTIIQSVTLSMVWQHSVWYQSATVVVHESDVRQYGTATMTNDGNPSHLTHTHTLHNRWRTRPYDPKPRCCNQEGSIGGWLGP